MSCAHSRLRAYRGTRAACRRRKAPGRGSGGYPDRDSHDPTRLGIMSNCMFRSGRRRFRASVRAAPREPSIVLAGIDRSSALAGLSKLPVLALPAHQAWARFALGGRTLVDRVLYLPKTCTEDRECCRVAEVPDEREFATKGDLARHIVLRLLASPLPRCTARTGSRTVPAGPAPAPGPARYQLRTRLRQQRLDPRPRFVRHDPRPRLAFPVRPRQRADRPAAT